MDKEIEYDILMEFNYDGNDYVIFELNTFLETFTEELKRKFS